MQPGDPILLGHYVPAVRDRLVGVATAVLDSSPADLGDLYRDYQRKLRKKDHAGALLRACRLTELVAHAVSALLFRKLLQPTDLPPTVRQVAHLLVDQPRLEVGAWLTGVLGPLLDAGVGTRFPVATDIRRLIGDESSELGRMFWQRVPEWSMRCSPSERPADAQALEMLGPGGLEGLVHELLGAISPLWKPHKEGAPPPDTLVASRDPLLRSHPPDVLARLMAAAWCAEHEYPRIVAKPLEAYREAIIEDDYPSAASRYVQLLELCAQFVSAIILRSLERDGCLEDAGARGAVWKLLQTENLGIGTWLEQILLPLVRAGAKVDLEIACRLKVLFEKRYRKGFTGAYLLGRVPAFRNQIHHWGSEPNQESARTDLEREYFEAFLFDFLAALSPLRHHGTLAVEEVLRDSQGRKTYRVLYGSGTAPKLCKISSETELHERHLYLIETAHFHEELAAGHVLDLAPLTVHVRPPKDDTQANAAGKRLTYLFQCRAKEPRLKKYVSPWGARPKKTDLFNALLEALDARWLGGAPTEARRGLSQERAEESWAHYRSLADEVTDAFLGAVSGGRLPRRPGTPATGPAAETTTRDPTNPCIVGAKYDPDLYVRREAIHTALEAFEKNRGRNGFVLLGGAGSGKTNLLCNEAERLRAEGHLVVLYYARSLGIVDLSERIRETFESRKALDELLRELDALAQAVGKQVFFLFDAINECQVAHGPGDRQESTPAALVSSIDRKLVRRHLRQVKVLMSCRSYTWKEARSERRLGVDPDRYFTSRDLAPLLDSQDDEHRLGGFTPRELELAYGKYRDRYGLQTTWEELVEEPDDRRLGLLEDPFRLGLVARHYRNERLPGNLDTHDVLALVFDSLTQGGQADRMRTRALLDELTALLWTRRLDAIPLDQIHALTGVERTAQSPLTRTLWFEDDWSYTPQLSGVLDAGILRIEEHPTTPVLGFTYDRLHEHLLAHYFLGWLQAQLHAKESEGADRFFKDRIAETGGHAVGWGALRAALLLDIQQRGDTSQLFGLAESPQHECRSLAVDVIGALVQQDAAMGFDLLAALGEPSEKQRADAKTEIELGGNIHKEAGRLKLRGAVFRRWRERRLVALRAERERLRVRLAPLLRRKRASLKVLYDLCRAWDFELPVDDPVPPPRALGLFVRALRDPDLAQRDAATLHLYYLWKQRPKVALETMKLHLGLYLELHSLKRLMPKTISDQLEPSARVSGLILCDSLLRGGATDDLETLRALWREVIDSLPRQILRPAAYMLLNRAAKGVSEYVNNLVEYQHFFDRVPTWGLGWTKRGFTDLVPYLEPGLEGFESKHELIVRGAARGDACTNYLLERVLIAQGVDHYHRIDELVRRIFHNQANERIEYTQMSMLYVLFHTMDKSAVVDAKAFTDFQDYMRPWTLATRGYFMAHRNVQANGGRPYKQYTLNWYGALHSKVHQDGAEDMKLFREYAVKAFEDGNTDLFLYVLDNIAMLAADFGYWKSALRAFEHCLSLFQRREDLERFPPPDPEQLRTRRRQIEIRHRPASGLGEAKEFVEIRSYLARTLATIRGYRGPEVDRFVREDLAAAQFPERDKFRADLQNFESGENLGDLLTHKFGNFFVVSIVRYPKIRRMIQQVLTVAPRKRRATRFASTIAATVSRPVLGFDLKDPTYGVEPEWLAESTSDQILVWTLRIAHAICYLPMHTVHRLFGWAKLDWVALDLLSVPGAVFRGFGALFGERGRRWGLRANALEHAHLVCRFCPEERQALRDPHGGGTCVWAWRWARGEFDIPPHFGVKNWITQYANDTDLTDYEALALPRGDEAEEGRRVSK